MKSFHLTTSLIDRVDAVEFAYSRDRMTAIRDVLGNPNSVAFMELKNLRALAAPKIPSPYLNRILASGLPDTADLDSVLSWHPGAAPGVELSPGACDQTV